jgi:hypothetical protein
MIIEYIENLRTRLNQAVKDGKETEVRRISYLMNAVITDGDKVGESMPWDAHCPLCGTALPSQSEGGK